MASASVAKPADSIMHAEVDEVMMDTNPAEETAAEEDLYTQLKTLQRQLEFYEIQVRKNERFNDQSTRCIAATTAQYEGLHAYFA